MWVAQMQGKQRGHTEAVIRKLVIAADIHLPPVSRYARSPMVQSIRMAVAVQVAE